MLRKCHYPPICPSFLWVEIDITHLLFMYKHYNALWEWDTQVTVDTRGSTYFSVLLYWNTRVDFRLFLNKNSPYSQCIAGKPMGICLDGFITDTLHLDGCLFSQKHLVQILTLVNGQLSVTFKY